MMEVNRNRSNTSLARLFMSPFGTFSDLCVHIIRFKLSLLVYLMLHTFIYCVKGKLSVLARSVYCF